MNDTIKNRTGNQNRESDRERKDRPVYSHNPYHSTKFPLLVLDVERERCAPYNEGFRSFTGTARYSLSISSAGSCIFVYGTENTTCLQGTVMFINANATHYITEKEDCRYHSFLIRLKCWVFLMGA